MRKDVITKSKVDAKKNQLILLGKERDEISDKLANLNIKIRHLEHPSFAAALKKMRGILIKCGFRKRKSCCSGHELYVNGNMMNIGIKLSKYNPTAWLVAQQDLYNMTDKDLKVAMNKNTHITFGGSCNPDDNDANVVSLLFQDFIYNLTEQ